MLSNTIFTYSKCICVKLELTHEPHEHGAQAQRLFVGDDLSLDVFFATRSDLFTWLRLGGC